MVIDLERHGRAHRAGPPVEGADPRHHAGVDRAHVLGFSMGAHIALTAALVLIGYVARVTRVSVIEVMESPYVRTAVLKGLRRRRVILQHVLRNALIAPIAIITTQMNWLIGGLIVLSGVILSAVGSAKAAKEGETHSK